MKVVWRLSGRTADERSYIFVADPSWEFAPDMKVVEISDFWRAAS